MMRVVIVFGLVLIVPVMFEKLRLPGVLGLIVVGLVFGPWGFHLFKENAPTLVIFATLGKLLLLFFSGLDIELDVLKKNIGKAIGLAALSFLIPAVAGMALGLTFGYDILTSLMIAVLFSSHSIITYPILVKLGLQKHEPVTVTIAATALTDIASLVLLAICLPIHTTGFLIGPFLLQITYIVAFIPVIIFGCRWLGKKVFKRLGEDPAQQMIFLLVVIGISAEAADLVNIEPIIGAFLAGLAVGTTLPNIGVRAQLETLGNTLFVPAFFISLGILIDPAVLVATIRDHFALVSAVLIVVLGTKLLAAWLAGKSMNYSVDDRILMGSLTLPQVSSTLAVAIVAYESMNARGERLIDESILNSILVLMVLSAIIGSVWTERVARRIAGTGSALQGTHPGSRPGEGE